MPRRDPGDARWQAELFRALGDANRLRIVHRLLSGDASVGEIAEALGAEQSLVSHHLAALRGSGIVEARRKGRAVLYDLPERVRGAIRGRTLDLGCCLVTFRVPPRDGAARHVRSSSSRPARARRP
jgi:ArsR family transcriptional regulator